MYEANKEMLTGLIDQTGTKLSDHHLRYWRLPNNEIVFVFGYVYLRCFDKDMVIFMVEEGDLFLIDPHSLFPALDRFDHDNCCNLHLDWAVEKLRNMGYSIEQPEQETDQPLLF